MPCYRLSIQTQTSRPGIFPEGPTQGLCREILIVFYLIVSSIDRAQHQRPINVLIPELPNYCLKKRKVYEFQTGRFHSHGNMEGAKIEYKYM